MTLFEDLPICQCHAGCPYELYPSMKFRILRDKSTGSNVVAVEVNEKVSGRLEDKYPTKVLPKDYWEFIPMSQQLKDPGLEKTQVLLSPSQVFYLLKEIDQEFIEQFVTRRELLFLSCLPVMPNCNRITEISIGSDCPKVIFDDRTKAYKKLVDAKKKDEIQLHEHSHEDMTAQVLECLSFSKLHPMSLLKRGPTSGASGLRWIKDVVLCKRTDFGCRMTVIGDPSVKLGEIGVPEEISFQLFAPEYITSHNQLQWDCLCNGHIQNGDFYVERDHKKVVLCHPFELKIGDILHIGRVGNGILSVSIGVHNRFSWNIICNTRFQHRKLFVKRSSKLVPLQYPVKLKIGDVLYRPLKDGDLLLVNRPPSVHQHSLIALSAKILPTKSVFSINPLCCAPFSGDFDGDCLHVYVPQSIHSKVELSELVCLGNQLLNGQDGRSLISLSQDSLTSSHLLMGERIFLRSTEIQQLQMSSTCIPLQPAILKAPLLREPLWTGQQLFSSVLPTNLNFAVPHKLTISKGKVLVCSSESSWLQNHVGSLFSEISKHFGSKGLNHFFLAQKILTEWISMRGFSVSLEDIYLSSDAHERAKMIEEVLYGIQEAEQVTYVESIIVDPGMSCLLKDYIGREDSTTDAEEVSLPNCKHKILNQYSFAAYSKVLMELQHVLCEYARKSNSMLSMIHAGSKGSLAKLLHQSVCLGLQHSKAFFSFRIPSKLSCSSWNQCKMSSWHVMIQGSADYSEGCSTYAVIRSSLLDGLNPLECFLHSLSGRMNMFSENAEFPGTLTRKLMYYMRDLYFTYDGSVRSFYGQQVVQFSYDVSCHKSTKDVHLESYIQAGEPLGALAACSISEAAYSALDLTCNTIEISPLLKLKNLFERHQKGIVSERTISLTLSKKLRRRDHGFEYAALEVQKQLERVFLSDIVSTILVFYAGQDVKKGTSPWVTHFHMNKESLSKHRLNVEFVIDVLNKRYQLTGEKINSKLPKLHISSRCCVLDKIHKGGDSVNCITVAADNCEVSVELDGIRETIIPVLLCTVIKGLLEVKRVEILWNDQHSLGSCQSSSGLYLKVVLSEDCELGKGWNLVKNACIPVMDLIDWECSHPENVFEIFREFGIDAGWKYFVTNLMATTCRFGKKIHKEHLHLVADCLSVTGVFHHLSAKEMKLQKEQLSVLSPFVQGFFATPEKEFIDAAKKGSIDQLLGSVDSLAWGKEPPLGAGGPFELLYTSKVQNAREIGNVYDCVKHQCSLQGELNRKVFPLHSLFDKQGSKLACTYNMRSQVSNDLLETNGYIGVDAIPLFTRLLTSLRKILHEYPMDAYLREEDKALVASALNFHPMKDDKIGTGIKDIKIGCNRRFPGTRCYIVERIDGTSVDFSYRKCLKGAFKQFSPEIVERIKKTTGKGSFL